MKSVVHQSKKKTKNVQRAAEKTPEENKTSSEVSAQEQTETLDIPAMPFDLSKVDPKKIALAEEMGIPIKQLIDWASSVEKRFQIIARDVAAAPQKVVEALKTEATKAQQARLKHFQETGNQGQGQNRRSGVVGELLSVLQGGGLSGGVDEEMLKMQKQMFGLNIQRMKKDMDFTDAIKNAIVTKIAGKAAAELLTE